MHKKSKYKIPADLGGSGAQFLLTYLTTLLDSFESIISFRRARKSIACIPSNQISKIIC